MRYRVDVLCVGISILYLLLRTVAVIATIDIYIGVVLFCLLQMMVISIKHNHIHLPVFLSSRWNRLFDYILSLSTGFTTSSIRVIHNINHHVHNDTDQDWGSTQRFASVNSFRALLQYLMETPIQFFRHKKQWYSRNKGHRLSRQNVYENVFLFSYLVALVSLGSTVHFVAFIVLPMIGSQVFLVGLNFFQHYRCTAATVYSSSRNFTGRIFNGLFFNVGYHTAHHLRPRLHWSKLRAAHMDIEDKVPREFCEKSFLKFVYGFLTKRDYGNVREVWKTGR